MQDYEEDLERLVTREGLSGDVGDHGGKPGASDMAMAWVVVDATGSSSQRA